MKKKVSIRKGIRVFQLALSVGGFIFFFSELLLYNTLCVAGASERLTNFSDDSLETELFFGVLGNYIDNPDFDDFEADGLGYWVSIARLDIKAHDSSRSLVFRMNNMRRDSEGKIIENRSIAGLDQNEVVIRNAYLDWRHPFGHRADLRLGRQNLFWGNGLVLDTVQDGLRLRFDRKIDVELYSLMVKEANSPDVYFSSVLFEEDIDSFGFSLEKDSGSGTGVGLLVLQVSDAGGAREVDNRTVFSFFGRTVTGDGLKLRCEFATLSGLHRYQWDLFAKEPVEIEGQAIWLTVGKNISFSEKGSIDLRGDYLRASGDDSGTPDRYEGFETGLVRNDDDDGTFEDRRIFDDLSGNKKSPFAFSSSYKDCQAVSVRILFKPEEKPFKYLARHLVVGETEPSRKLGDEFYGAVIFEDSEVKLETGAGVFYPTSGKPAFLRRVYITTSF